MRLYLGLIVLVMLLTSCDDGEIIVTTFDFDEENLTMCSSNTREKVLYHTNNLNVFESLSMELSNNLFTQEDQVLTVSDNPIEIPLSGNNRIIYRTYNAEVPEAPGDYFCRDIPPATPTVLQEYESVGGIVVITTSQLPTLNRDGVLDHDGDGIPSIEEGMDEGLDTDGDGIPDYLDRDDDGDNVETSVERDANTDDPTANGYLDTDEDGIPNYLDPDDDGDGVLTRLEVTEDNLYPARNQNDENTSPRYLDPNFTQRYTGEPGNLIDNIIKVRYRSDVVVQNLQLRNLGGDGEEISFTLKNLGSFTSGQVDVVLEPTDEGGDEDDTDNNNEG